MIYILKIIIQFVIHMIVEAGTGRVFVNPRFATILEIIGMCIDFFSD